MGARASLIDGRFPEFAYWRDRMVEAVAEKPWDITIKAGGVAQFTNCYYNRGPLIAYADVADHALSGGDGDVIWVAAKINTESGYTEILSGDYNDVFDTKVPTDEYVKLPLYRLRCSATEDGKSFSVTLDLRDMGLTLYV